MATMQRAKLFRNGQNQAVRIPREFEFPGKEVTIRKDGENLILEPVPEKGVAAVSALLDSWTDDLGPDEAFPEIEDLPADPVDL